MSKIYKVIIIDDEPRARALLKGMLNEYCPDLKVIDECENLPSGVLSIKAYQPDLVLLDIEMPGYSGLEILDFFKGKEIDFSIIFTTAYNQYAIRAFKLSAIDYLLKPIEAQELEDAIARFRALKVKSNFNVDSFAEILKPDGPSKIAVPVGNTIQFIDLDDLRFFKADSSYTEIWLKGGQHIIVSRTLKNFEEALEGNINFFRCHKSYLINIKSILTYVKSEGGYLILESYPDFSIPITSDRVQYLMDQKLLVKR
jgi:two-component system LytT family response regulator